MWKKLPNSRVEKENLEENNVNSISDGMKSEFSSGEPLYIETEEEEDSPRNWMMDIGLRYLRTLLLGIGLAGIYLLFKINGSRVFNFYLINALFISGVILSGIGGMSAINKDGFFDIAQFGLKKVFKAKSIRGDDNTVMDFYDYKKQKWEMRVAKWDWVIVGGLFLILSVVCMQFEH